LYDNIGHLDLIRALQFDDTNIISGSFDQTIKIWDSKSYECEFSLLCHTKG